jgi:hypothetical protein
LLRWNIFDSRCKLTDLLFAEMTVYTLSGRWLVFATDPLAPGLARPDRSRDETTATVRANILQDVIDAVGTEGALIGTDACDSGLRREVAVTEFAIRMKFQHLIGSPGVQARP